MKLLKRLRKRYFRAGMNNSNKKVSGACVFSQCCIDFSFFMNYSVFVQEYDDPDRVMLYIEFILPGNVWT